MNIRDAKFCPDCEEIYEPDRWGICPYCGSPGVWIETWVRPCRARKRQEPVKKRRPDAGR